MRNFTEKYFELLKEDIDPVGIDQDLIKDCISKAIEQGANHKFERGDINLIILMEEMAELIKVLSKYIRYRDNKPDVIEEVVDVYIYLNAAKEILSITDKEFETGLKVKLDRFKKRLSNEEFFKEREV